MKNIKNYLLTALLALTLAFGMTGITTLTKASAVTELKANLNVGQDISLVISAEIPNAGEVTATFAWNGKEAYSDTVVGEKQGETNEYKFFYRGLSAQYMAKDIEVTVKNGETEVATANTSIKQILNSYISSSAEKLNISEKAYKKLKTLSADILSYGKAAEKYLNMTDDIGEVTGGSYVDFTAIEGKPSVTGNLKWNAGITFDYNLRPAVKVYIPAETYKDTLVAKIDRNVATLTATDTPNVYTLTYSNYNILDIDKDYKFEIFDGETSLGSYTSSLAALAKESNAEIVKAAYVYGSTIVRYADAINNFSMLIEAEDCTYLFNSDGTESDTKYTAVQDYSGIQIVENETVKDGGALKFSSSGKGAVKDLQTNYSKVYFKFKVNILETGTYKLKARGVSYGGKLWIGNKWKVNINGAKDSNGNYTFDTQWNSPLITTGNRIKEYSDNTKLTADWTNLFWWSYFDLFYTPHELKQGENEIRIYMDSGYPLLVDYFEVVKVCEEKAAILNYRAGTTEYLDGETLVIDKDVKLTDIVKTPDGHPVKYTLLYLRTVTGAEVPILESMLGDVDYTKVGVPQKITVTDPVSKESASFTLFIKG